MNDMTTIAKTRVETTFKDWETDQEVRWCPGCGDYAILKAVQRTLADVGADPKNTAFISGIGCSSRFPYYIESYGFHTIHAARRRWRRASSWPIPTSTSGSSPATATRSRSAAITPCMCCAAISTARFLFNNEIYGLTKGQYSPTSREGTRSPSTPFGSVDHPAKPAAFALGSGARFVARGFDVSKNLTDVLKAAYAHRGAAFVEIFQNCIVYNKDVFADFTEKKNADLGQLWLEDGKPMLFDKGLKACASISTISISKSSMSSTATGKARACSSMT